MKITYDNDIFAMQKYGGISRYYVELFVKINELYGNNTSVEMLGGIHRNEYLRKLKSKKKPFYVPNFKGAGTILNKFNQHFIDRASNFNTDVYHATYYRFPKRLPERVKKFITVYDMIHELYPSYFGDFDKTVKLKEKAIMEADHIFAISQNTKQDLIKIYQVPDSKITVTYLGVDHLSVKMDGDSRRENFLLYVGPRGGYKNFRGVLGAFAKLLTLSEKLHLVAFGGGSFNFEEKALMNELNIPSERVKQISGSDNVLADLYSRALVFVYPSLYEGFGIPPLEAMARGCPVAASITSSIGEVLGSAASLFDPNDLDDIIDKIGKMISDTGYRNSFVDIGYRQVKKYTWEETAKVTLETYSSLLK